MELFEAINSRRSIRRYTTDPVDDDKVNKVLEAGRWAPSWANTQCWKFVVVRDPDIKARIGQSLMGVKIEGKPVDNLRTCWISGDNSIGLNLMRTSSSPISTL